MVEDRKLYTGEEDFYGGDEEAIPADVKGGSDSVSSYTYTNLSYPCILFKEGFACPKHQLTVISNMVNSKGIDKDISIYFNKEGDLFKIGSISGRQLNAFLEIVGTDVVYGYYDAETRLKDDLLYTLCTIF